MGKDLKGKDLGKGISQRKDGRYSARYTNRYGERKTLYSFKLQDIKRMLRDAIYEDDHGLNGNGINITVDDWFEEWMKLYKSKTIKSTTVYKIRAYHTSRVSPIIGKMYLKDVKVVHLQKLMNGLLDDGLTVGTASNIKTQISDMLKRAVQNDYIQKNPCESVELPKQIKKEKQILTMDEQRKFLEFASSYMHINVIKVALLTGARIGEILGLKWSDVDFDQRIIDINKTIHYSKASSPNEGSKFFYSSVKTTASERVLPMSDELFDVLKVQREKQLKDKMMNKKVWKQHEEFTDLVFTQTNGNPVNYFNVNDGIKDYVEKMNIIECGLAKEEDREPVKFPTFTCHVLRHTYSSRCYEQGMSNKVLQTLLGHANVETTLNIYTHVNDESRRDAVEKLKLLA